ncbi:hypothetical protein ACE3KB_06150 [Enterobacter hormaechei subsp. oharae]
MKLIDILVRELPNLGGWPDGVIKMSQDYDGEVWCWRGHDYGTVNSFSRISEIADNHRKQSQDEELSCFVTREQYEAAIASSKPEWDGVGLPPVGTECEYSLNAGRTWFKCKIDYVLGTQGLIMLADVYEGGQFVGFAEYDGKLKFRPIRSEADKKRDEAVESIKAMLMYDYGDDPRLNDAVILYDAIASGKIPHIRID